MINYKQMDEKQNKLLNDMSDDQLEDSVKRLNMLINSQPWDNESHNGFVKALSKIHDQIITRVQNKTWTRGHI